MDLPGSEDPPGSEDLPWSEDTLGSKDPFGSEAPGNVGDKDANWKRKHAYITRSQGSAPPLSKKLCKGYP